MYTHTRSLNTHPHTHIGGWTHDIVRDNSFICIVKDSNSTYLVLLIILYLYYPYIFTYLWLVPFWLFPFFLSTIAQHQEHSPPPNRTSFNMCQEWWDRRYSNLNILPSIALVIFVSQYLHNIVLISFNVFMTVVLVR